jgi:ATPase involved in DNA replication initiation
VIWDKMLQKTWELIRADLKKDVGANAYKSWISPIELVSVKKSEARFLVPTAFIGNWVSRNYGEKILLVFRIRGLN